MLDGFGKEDTTVRKKLPVEADILEWLCIKGLYKELTEHKREIGDSSSIPLYFLLIIG